VSDDTPGAQAPGMPGTGAPVPPPPPPPYVPSAAAPAPAVAVPAVAGAAVGAAAFGAGGAASGPHEDPITHGPEDEPEKKRPSAVREVVVIVVVALVVSALVRALLFQAFFIPSASMENTLKLNDRVIVSKIGQHLGPVHRGDIVVFKDPGGWLPAKVASDNVVARAAHRTLEVVGLAPSASDQDVIKRVIGVPGDHVVCCDASGKVTVNGVALDEPYVYPGDSPSDIKFDVVVPPGRLFVMGDHRSDSGDSRVHLSDVGQGTIPEKNVIGRAVLLVWPFNRWKTLGVPATFKNPALNNTSSTK